MKLPLRADEPKLTVAYYIEAKDTRIVTVPVRRLKAAALGLVVALFWTATALAAFCLSVSRARWTEIIRLASGAEPQTPGSVCAAATERTAHVGVLPPAATGAAGVVGVPPRSERPRPAIGEAKPAGEADATAAGKPVPTALSQAKPFGSTVATTTAPVAAGGAAIPSATAPVAAPAKTVQAAVADPAKIAQAAVAAPAKTLQAAVTAPVKSVQAAVAAPLRAAAAGPDRDVRIGDVSYTLGTSVVTANVALASRNGGYVHGRVWGVARFLAPGGGVTLVASHAGIDPADPTNAGNARVATPFGAERLTRKQLTLPRPAAPGARLAGLELFVLLESAQTPRLLSKAVFQAAAASPPPGGAAAK